MYKFDCVFCYESFLRKKEVPKKFLGIDTKWMCSMVEMVVF